MYNSKKIGGNNMKQLERGEVVIIHSYKHNGHIHRVWKKSIVIKETDDLLIVYNDRTKVIESSGRRWYSREPAIVYFYKKRWFNIIAMLREDGIYFYCNLSSPYLYDGEAIKYIDYDLDLKVYPDFKYKILDRKEFKYHAQLMNYSKEIKSAVEDELDILVGWLKKRRDPFNHTEIFKQYEIAKKIINRK